MLTNEMKLIEFWCQKILPLVYDDSLSYYEVLEKTVDYLNKVIEDDKNIIELVNNLETWVNENREYIDNYFENLNVQNEINVKLDEMVDDGTFGEIIDPILEQFEQDAMGNLSQQVSDWLEENITPTTPVIDATLTVSGAGADAKVTGDEITDLKKDIFDSLKTWKPTLVSNEYISTAGEITKYDGWSRTDYIDCSHVDEFTVNSPVRTSYCHFYTSDKTPISSSFVVEAGETTISTRGYSYFIISAPTASMEEMTITYKMVSGADALNALNDVSDFTLENNIERGDINASVTPPTWVQYGIRTRIRTIKGMGYDLKVGDVIESSSCLLYLAWKNTNGVWNSTGWIERHVVTEAGNYSILARKGDSSEISDVNALAKEIHIHRYGSFLTELNNNIYVAESENYINSVSHRGLNAIAPENSPLAFILASQYGFNCAETDVRFTSDDVPVLLHDDTINRTARNADGTEISTTINITDITYEQALTYDFGIYLSSQYAGTKICSFDDYIKTCRNVGIMPYIEPKAFDRAHIEILFNIVRKYGMVRKVTWICINPSALSIICELDPYARIGLVGDVVIETLEGLKTANNEVFSDCALNLLTSEKIESLKTANIDLESYTYNDTDSIINADPYITGFTSDYIPAGKILKLEQMKRTL